VLGLIALMIAGCSLPKLPQGASWDAQVSFPIAAHTYSLWELAENDSLSGDTSSAIGMSLPDSALFFKHVREFEPIYPADSLWLEPMEYQIEELIEYLRIPVNMQETAEVTLGALNPALIDSDGIEMDVPPFPFYLPTVAFPFGGDFILACADSGRIEMRLRNTLPFAVNDLRVNWVGASGAVSLFDGRLAVEADTVFEHALSGDCVGKNMHLEIAGEGEGGTRITIDISRGLALTISVGVIRVNYFEGQIPEQVTWVDLVYQLKQRHQVREAEIASGALFMTATNYSPISDSLRVILDDFLTPQGEAVQIKHYLPPAQPFEFSLNLAGYMFRPANPLRQEIHVRLEVLLLPTDTVTFQAGCCSVAADFHIDTLTFRYFDGVVDTIENPIGPDSTAIEQPPEGWENIHPAVIDLFLTARSSIAAHGNVNLSLHSTREGREIGLVSYAEQIAFGYDDTLMFTGLAALAREFPEYIGYSGTVGIGGPVVIYDTSKISGKIELKAPIMFILEDMRIPGDIEKVEPDPIEELQEVSLHVRLWNRLPFSGTLSVIAAFDSAAVMQNSGLPAETLFTLSLPEAQLDGGRVVAPGDSSLDISPPLESYDFMRHPPFYVRPELFIRGTGGDTVAAYGSDYVRFSVTASIKYRISLEGGS